MKRNGLPFVAREFRHRRLNSRSIGPKVVSYDTKAGANQQQFVAYDVIMEWHLQEMGVLGPNESVGGCDLFISQQKLMEKLRRRYHMSTQYASPCTISLPHLKSKVTVWKKDARDNVVSLLTDPRWTTEDWLYFDDDPFAAPPDNLSYVGDLNTG